MKRIRDMRVIKLDFEAKKKMNKYTTISFFVFSVTLGSVQFWSGLT